MSDRLVRQELSSALHGARAQQPIQPCDGAAADRLDLRWREKRSSKVGANAPTSKACLVKRVVCDNCTTTEAGPCGPPSQGGSCKGEMYSLGVGVYKSRRRSVHHAVRRKRASWRQSSVSRRAARGGQLDSMGPAGPGGILLQFPPARAEPTAFCSTLPTKLVEISRMLAARVNCWVVCRSCCCASCRRLRGVQGLRRHTAKSGVSRN